MSPRFKRYVRRSLLPIGLMFLVLLLVNWAATRWNIAWLHLTPWSAAVAVLTVFYLRWLTRANPQDSE
ncbi:hypothetical protein Dxin01_01587 [Deinococcus xinjiangensis]|uniref:Uncharacterized protein n=1 Tax=Deinococcus xinjiangensis TaxID=457454 RepID=A0ABP9VEU3_9DEIO